MDLLTGWDFEKKEDQNRCIEQVLREKPMLVVGSPPCTYFSTLQELNKFNQRFNLEWMEKFNMNLVKAIEHIKFCIKIYLIQMEAGRNFLHEPPWGAKSWAIPEMEELLADARVEVSYADQCQFGLTSKIAVGSEDQCVI